MRLGILATHPIQYHAPLFRELSEQVDLHVYFAHRQTPQGQAAAGFGVEFEWDVPLTEGYRHSFLENIADKPSTDTFGGCNTPGIVEEIQQGKFDAFLVMGWYNRSYLQAIRTCWRTDTPVMIRGDSQLVTPRSPLKRLAKEAVYRWFIPRFDRYLLVGQRSREYYLHYGADERSMHFVPHFVDNDWFASRAANVDRSAARAALGIGESDRVALFAGKFIDKKRPHDLLRAVASIGDTSKDWVVVFVGSGPLDNSLVEEAALLDVRSQFVGFKNQSELPAYYVLADVLVLPSDGGETWGLVVNEAMACGTPAIVSDAVGCSADLIEEGQTGFTYPLGNTDAMAARLQEAAGMRDTPMVQSALRTKVDAYSLSRAVDGVMEAMEAARA